MLSAEGKGLDSVQLSENAQRFVKLVEDENNREAREYLNSLEEDEKKRVKSEIGRTSYRWTLQASRF